jgi:hypothetical protein
MSGQACWLNRSKRRNQERRSQDEGSKIKERDDYQFEIPGLVNIGVHQKADGRANQRLVATSVIDLEDDEE